ncbi:MalY/PatB family protein [Breznakiella homolactica]|uniref:cysteine-S-conjugate beta-lyase n=1 Tax=Breznakiella homolactica TaxID=2798577 RepID=A0A7T7XRB4_9SPIR|nr:MalY/PatB family protein [Breznakiella homolactica]QQO11066.1 pyridoxal phosphate-dependent aminotransferase [Breznakiella homolactica]
MDFDTVINRRGTGSIKWDSLHEAPGKPDVIPLWVADMDFASPPEMVTKIQERAAHPIYGYMADPPGFFEALRDWYRGQYGVDLEPESLLSGPGTVPSMGILVRTFSEPGDSILVPTPVYYPFYTAVESNGRRILEVPLTLNGNGRLEFSADRVEAVLSGAREKGIRVPMLMFCSPHNPGGTVWKKDELESILALAKKYDMVAACDEIHGDFVHTPGGFVSMADFPEFADRVVVFSGANKTFNLGGLHVSHFVARDENLRERIREGLKAAGHSVANIFSVIAVENAYRYGAPWLAELKPYLLGNIDAAVEKINREIPGVRAYRPEGTYLIWADASELVSAAGYAGDMELCAALEEEGRVKFTQGSLFGAGGRGFIRINTACPRSLLMEGLDRLNAWASARMG